MRPETPAVGDDGQGDMTQMTTMTATARPLSDSRATRLVAIAGAALLGLGLMFVAGHVQANGLHDAAHDMRHATGFPCH